MKMVIIYFQDNEMEKEDTGTTTETQYEYTEHPKLSHVSPSNPHVSLPQSRSLTVPGSSLLLCPGPISRHCLACL